ncbi:MAG: hypothetical protein RLZZ116_2010 [Planctomycetota bacterium]
MNLKAMAVVASGVVASIASGDAIQWRVQDGGNGHWYQGVSSKSGWTWSVARTIAESVGGALVSCELESELQFVRSSFSLAQAPALWQVQSINALAQMGPWIGASQAPGSAEPSGGWTWLSGVPFDPQDNINCCGNDCSGVQEDRLHLYAQQSTGWTVAINDLTDDPSPCSDQIRAAIFEWSADCNNDGIVDYGQCRDGTLPDYNSNNIPDCCEQGMACAVADYPMQWRTEDGGNGHWYSKSIWTSPKNWNDARASATARGADLVAISAAAENTWIVTRFDLSHDPCAGYRGWFIGAYQDLQASDYSEPNGGWRWSNGESWGWTNWRPGAPDNYLGNQHWALIDTPIEGQAWDDVGGGPGGPEPICRAIFEWSADCNSDGVVDFGQILGGELADVDGNGVPDDCECVADLDGDGVVASEDLAAVLNNWGTKGGVIDADVNNDGIVDGSDLSIVLNGWGACP